MKPIPLFWRMAALALWTAAGAATAQIVPWPAEDTVWYTGSKPGAVNVVVVAPEQGLGDAPALAARMDADVTALPLERFQDESRVKLPNADVLVIAHTGIVPPSGIQNAVLKQLHGAKGVVLVRYERDAPVARGALADLLERSDSAPLSRGLVLQPGMPAPDIEVYEKKRTRLAVISYNTPAPLSHCLVARPREDVPLNRGDYDSAMALPVRAVLWAAGVDFETRIVDVAFATAAKLDPADIPPGLEPAEASLLANLGANPQLEDFRVQFNRPLDRYYELTGRIRHPQLGVASSYTLTLDKGTESFTMQIPVGYHDYVADITLSDDGVTYDWFSVTGRKMGWPYFKSVAFSASRIAANDTVSVTAEVPAHPASPQEARLWLRARDSLGRTVALEHRGVPPEGGRFTVHADLKGLLAPALRIDAYATTGERTVLAPGAVLRAAAASQTVPAEVPFESPFVFAARAALTNEWGMWNHYRMLRGGGVQVVTPMPPYTRYENAARNAGLFPPAALNGVDPMVVNVARRAPDAASFAVWRALLAQGPGIEVHGMELPRRPAGPNEDGPAAAWAAVVSAMNAIRGGWDALVIGADLISRGAVRDEDTGFWPETFTPRRARFQGEWFEYGWDSGAILALLPDPAADRARVRFETDPNAAWYAPLDEPGVVQSKTINLAMEPGRPSFVVRLPYEVSRVLVDAPTACKAGSLLELSVTVRTREQLPGKHVFHVTIRPEGGEPLRHYARTVSGDAGSARVVLPLAINEQPGVYTVQAVDVLTGTTGEAEVSVLPR